jgi:hypothetical protein
MSLWRRWRRCADLTLRDETRRAGAWGSVGLFVRAQHGRDLGGESPLVSWSRRAKLRAGGQKPDIKHRRSGRAGRKPASPRDQGGTASIPWSSREGWRSSLGRSRLAAERAMASSRSETSAEVVVVARGTLREELNEVERQKTGRLRIPTTSACDSEMTSAGASGLAAW